MTRRRLRSIQDGGVGAALQIYSNHWGYFEFRLCPLRSPTSAGELAVSSEPCLAQHQLRAVATDTGVAAGNKVWLVDGAPGMTVA